MSENMFERDDYEHQDDGISSPEDELSLDDQDTVLEEGYSPPERPRGLDEFGTTLAEERQGETLDQRLAQEEPDPNATLVLDDGPRTNDEPGEVGGAGASAEEAAVHVVDLDEADAAVARDEGSTLGSSWRVETGRDGETVGPSL